MSDLVDFLRARLDEDEATARAAARNYDSETGRAEWTVDGLAIVAADGHCVAVTELADDEDDRAHIARWDPKHVLLEVATKRRVLRTIDAGGRWRALRTRRQMNAYREWAEHVLHLLALPYTNHPKYQSEWAP